MAEPEPLSIRGALDLPPDEALAAFRARDARRVSVSWRDFRPEEHARAFTAAKIASLDLLSDLQTSLDAALAEGKTFAQWQQEIIPTLERYRWIGLVENKALTGTSRPVFVGGPRLRTIFATNMRVARAAGQWQRIQALKEQMPYLRYSAVLDDRVRPEHRAWHGIIRPVDDPVWQRIYPPNGWNCRCQVIQLSEAQMAARGWRVTPDDRLPPLTPRGLEWFGRPRQARPVLRGIDAGWDYNPGAESLRGLTEKLREALERAVEAGNEAAARQVIEALGDRAIVSQFLAQPGDGLPLAILTEDFARAIGSTVRVATLSRRSVTHIREERGRALPADVYRAAQRAIDNPLLLVIQPNGRAAIVFAHEGRLHQLVLRAVAAKGELWVATMFRIRPASLPRLRRTGEVLVDRLQEVGAR